MTYEGQPARKSNRVLITLVVITIAVVAMWAMSGGLEDITVTEGQTVDISE